MIKIKIKYMEKNSYKIKNGPFRAPMVKTIHLRKHELFDIYVLHSIRVNFKIENKEKFFNADDQRRTP